MPTVTAHTQESEERPANPVADETVKPRAWIGWSSFFFALLQSLCTFFAAVDGLRLLIGLGALAVSAWMGAFIDKFHSDLIRLPMMGLALFGSLLNLVVLWQIHRLRARPAAQWRQRPVSRGKIRMERVQLVLSLVTLVLIAVEEYWHLKWHHHV
jgi:hypothetical protein